MKLAKTNLAWQVSSFFVCLFFAVTHNDYFLYGIAVLQLILIIMSADIVKRFK